MFNEPLGYTPIATWRDRDNDLERDIKPLWQQAIPALGLQLYQLIDQPYGRVAIPATWPNDPDETRQGLRMIGRGVPLPAEDQHHLNAELEQISSLPEQTQQKGSDTPTRLDRHGTQPPRQEPDWHGRD